ncbi:hypothetical protein Bca52824_069502 [Brassica carinata]|uniref:F-box domain-containing protein n=1 Tax=Brassica carinata TaxID=52824 RepID=A0A8X7Q3W0_BRACI|nr:hypothetical protein Bca52824_069502 [Brassica carinata]
MVDEAGDIIASQRFESPRETRPVAETVEGVDIISSMPREIIHHILSFIPTQLAIRTSALSKAWRHVWCEAPCLYFHNLHDNREKTARVINQTLGSYKAPKITSFHLGLPRYVPQPQINSWIEFVVSGNVEKLSLVFDGYMTHCFPDFFYRCSSLEELDVNFDMNLGCTISWKSLRTLTLNCSSNLNDESIDNILSDSPILETLTLYNCTGPQRLDLSKSRHLRRLDISGYEREPTEIFDDYVERYQGPTEIVAPHIQYLSRLSSSYEPFTLVDVPCLTEASLDIYIGCSRYILIEELPFSFKADIFQTAVLKMLKKLQNAERLSFGETLLQVMSLARFRGFSFPTFKVQTLTLKTSTVTTKLTWIKEAISRSMDSDIYSYLESQGLDPDQRFYPYSFFPTSDEFSEIGNYEESLWELVTFYYIP